MILADASAWIDFLRPRETPERERMRACIDHGRVVVTEPVLMEVLSGATSERHAEDLRHLLMRHTFTRVRSGDYVRAARVARACRRAGTPVRGHLDCLVAAVAMRGDHEVLANHRDFLTIAACVPLRLAQV